MTNIYDIRRLALIEAVKAEIIGMQAANYQRELINESYAYGEDAFQAKADELRDIVYAQDDQL